MWVVLLWRSWEYLPSSKSDFLRLKVHYRSFQDQSISLPVPALMSPEDPSWGGPMNFSAFLRQRQGAPKSAISTFAFHVFLSTMNSNKRVGLRWSGRVELRRTAMSGLTHFTLIPGWFTISSRAFSWSGLINPLRWIPVCTPPEPTVFHFLIRFVAHLIVNSESVTTLMFLTPNMHFNTIFLIKILELKKV